MSGEMVRVTENNMTKTNIISIDAETDGLYGPAWAIGAILADGTGKGLPGLPGKSRRKLSPTRG